MKNGIHFFPRTRSYSLSLTHKTVNNELLQYSFLKPAEPCLWWFLRIHLMDHTGKQTDELPPSTLAFPDKIIRGFTNYTSRVEFIFSTDNIELDAHYTHDDPAVT